MRAAWSPWSSFVAPTVCVNAPHYDTPRRKATLHRPRRREDAPRGSAAGLERRADPRLHRRGTPGRHDVLAEVAALVVRQVERATAERLLGGDVLGSRRG